MEEHERSYREQAKAAGASDIADWGEKETKGAYAPGTKFVINGMEFDPADADAIIARERPDGQK